MRNRSSRPRRSHILITAGFMVASLVAQAQTEYESISMTWSTAQLNFRLTDDIQLLFENSVRRSELFAEQMENMTRPSLEYRFNDEWRGILGYAYFSSFPYGNFPTEFLNNEHRIWQQLSHGRDHGQWRRTYRLRVEQRSQQQVRTMGDDIEDRVWVMEHRFRLHTMLERRWGNNNGHARHTPGVFAELLIRAGVHEELPPVDQWRAGVQYAFRPAPPLEFIGGYMFHYNIMADPSQVELGHVFLLQLTLDLDLRRGSR